MEHSLTSSWHFRFLNHKTRITVTLAAERARRVTVGIRLVLNRHVSLKNQMPSFLCGGAAARQVMWTCQLGSEVRWENGEARGTRRRAFCKIQILWDRVKPNKTSVGKFSFGPQVLDSSWKMQSGVSVSCCVGRPDGTAKVLSLIYLFIYFFMCLV